MAASYNTIAHRGSGVYEEKKSRFLGAAIPVSQEEDVRRELEVIRREHYDARHHCYAYILGEDRAETRASDDGEPQGTAGAPILKVIDGAGCTNVLIVVTRYFGGTLLGTGGLVRAYTAAARAALEDAGIVMMREGEVLHLVMAYSLLDKVNYILEQNGIIPEKPGYTDRVSMDITVPEEQSGKIREILAAAGSGSIEITELSRGYFPFREEDHV